MSRLEGKVCLVTGSSGGLGAAFCRKLVAEGAVVAAAGRSLPRLEPLVAELKAWTAEARTRATCGPAGASARPSAGSAAIPASGAGTEVSAATGTAAAPAAAGSRIATAPAALASADHLAVELDIGSWESVQAGVRQVEAALGRIDVLVNNAAAYGDLTRAPFWELPIDEWDRVLATNLRGPMLVSRAVVPGMRARRQGHIVNVASATFWSGSANWAHYVASKGGLIGLTRVMAKELGPDGICVNAVAPGFTLTAASLDLVPGAESYGVDRGCLKRAQQPEDVVGLVAFLASDESGFITGQTIIVDGGRQFN
ncbi:MAG: SDR family oxidoreductase [Thermoleophilia bacterium]|nr:SDR family oxidoreductase [Thermoleophilia bacterium]